MIIIFKKTFCSLLALGVLLAQSPASAQAPRCKGDSCNSFGSTKSLLTPEEKEDTETEKLKKTLGQQFKHCKEKYPERLARRCLIAAGVTALSISIITCVVTAGVAPLIGGIAVCAGLSYAGWQAGRKLPESPLVKAFQELKKQMDQVIELGVITHQQLEALKTATPAAP